MTTPPSIVWFHNDLRLSDNVALSHAARAGPIIPVFIWSPDEESPWQPGSASRWWLHHSLRALQTQLENRGLQLIVRTGPSLQTLLTIIRDSNAAGVVWNRRYEPALVTRDAVIRRELEKRGTITATFNSALVHAPDKIATKDGNPYTVYTPFWRAFSQLEAPEPIPVPGELRQYGKRLQSLALSDLQLLPKIDWDQGFREVWRPGEDGARSRLEEFLDDCACRYDQTRNLPAQPGTSRLSPHLHFGEIGVRQVWHAINVRKSVAPCSGAETFLKELVWREFAYHCLHHFPETTAQPLRREFQTFEWRESTGELRAWQRGRTGFPLVDAGMRELWHQGWMHNRVRMVAASFLTKNLRIHWMHGARWFWETLVDADLANNTLGWQWVAGCGADAAPYFRVFNPVIQSERFDSGGEYLRRWLPELGTHEGTATHQPWKLAPSTNSYPDRIVDLATSRQAALDAFRKLPKGGPVTVKKR